MKNIEQVCIICGNSRYDDFYNLSPYSLVKCQSCGLIQVYPIPAEETRRQINTSIYSVEEYKKRCFKDERFFRRWSKDKLGIIEKLMPAKGKMLDIGCSYGFFLDEASKQGWDTYGIEINTVTGSYARDKFGKKVFVGSLEESLFELSSFDVITLWDVIEHTPEPVNFLKLLKKYLKPQGIICVQVPNIDSFISHLKNDKWDWLTPGDHLYFFSKETLGTILGSAGFKIVNLFTWEPSGYFIDSLFGFSENNNFILELYRNTLVRIIRRLLFFIFIPFQRIFWKKDKGALLVTFAVLQN